MRLHIKKRNQEFVNAPSAARVNIIAFTVLIFEFNTRFNPRSTTATPRMASIVAKIKNHVQTVEFDSAFDHSGSVGISNLARIFSMAFIEW